MSPPPEPPPGGGPKMKVIISYRFLYRIYVIHVSIINYHVDMIKHVIVIHEHDITNLTR